LAGLLQNCWHFGGNGAQGQEKGGVSHVERRASFRTSVASADWTAWRPEPAWRASGRRLDRLAGPANGRPATPVPCQGIRPVPLSLRSAKRRGNLHRVTHLARNCRPAACHGWVHAARPRSLRRCRLFHRRRAARLGSPAGTASEAAGPGSDAWAFVDSCIGRPGAAAGAAPQCPSAGRPHEGSQSLRSVRQIGTRRRNASAWWLRFSQPTASRRQRVSQPIVCEVPMQAGIQRLGRPAKLLA